MSQNWLKTSLVVTPVIALMVGSGYYLWLDYQPSNSETQSRTEKELFGHISFADANVKRKSNDSVLWNEVSKQDPLYYLDSIRTGAESYAVIQLRDGSVIELNENSLIVLEKSSDQLSVDFKTGDVRTKQASDKLTFKVKDTTIQAQGAELKLKSDAQKDAQVVVTKGKAALVDAQKNRREIGPESLLNIDQRGQTQTVTVAVTLQNPADKVQLVSPLAETKGSFTWKVLDPNLREEVLEVSTDPNFSKQKTTSIRAHQAGSAPVKRGRNYWRVGWKAPKELANQNQPLLYSEVRTFVLTEDQRVTLVYPADDTAFETSPQDNDIEFTWRAEGQPKSYVLEFSDVSSFQRIRQTHKLQEAKYRATGLSSGLYFWRVTALGENSEHMGQSAPFSFEVNHVLPTLPALVKPDENYNWANQAPVRFEWKPVEDAQKYRVIVSKDKDAKQIIKSVIVQNSPYAWAWNKAGSYFWTVEVVNADSQAISRSQTRSFSVSAPAQSNLITLTLPLDQSEVSRDRKEVVEPVSFEWKSEKLTPANFTLLISKTPGFEKFLKTEKIEKNQVLVRLPEASIYFWKVIWTDPSHPDKTETSRTFQMKYNIPDGLPAPELIEPVKDALVKIPVKKVFDLTWKPVEKAKKYRVVLERIDERLNNKLPVSDLLVEEPKFSTVPLDVGNYEWRVHTIDEKDIQGVASEVRKLKVEMIDLLVAPKLKPPEIK